MVRQHGISIHALREEGDVKGTVLDLIARAISIHALREEGDYVDGPVSVQLVEFLSTPSARRATGHARSQAFRRCPISIHALREEGDKAMRQEIKAKYKISIHALREEGDRPAR